MSRVSRADAPGPADLMPADPVLASVVDNRLHAIAEQMADAMLRSCRSMVFQSRDFVTGVFTAAGDWVATKDFIPILAGSLPSAYAGIVDRFAGDVHPGDVFLLNDPYHGNNHPPDLTVMKPVFHQGTLRFWSVTKGHHADIGGSVPGYNPDAVDCWQDALRIPPVRLLREGVAQRDVWELILSNLRLRDVVEADLWCQIGATNVGERELVAMLDVFGVEPVLAAVDYQLEASRRHIRAEIGRIPDGVYRSVRHLDDGGTHHRAPIAVRLELIVRGEHAVLDFTGSDPQVLGYANSTYANTAAAALVALYAVTDPTQRRTSAALAAVEIRTRPGTIVHAVEPAATTLCTITTGEVIIETIWDAIGQADPARTNAGWCRSYGFAAMGVNERTGRPFGVAGALKGGSGATDGFDGWDVIGPPPAMGGGREIDVELHELAAPTTILSQEYETDSAGAGQWRGGLGGVSRWRMDQDDLAVLCVGSGTSAQTVPFGLAGGRPGPRNRSRVLHVDGRVSEPLPNSLFRLDRGDIVEIHTAGGAGHGDPRRRVAEAVAADVRDGLVSPAAAREVYGVAIDPSTGDVDRAATALLRADAGGGPGGPGGLGGPGGPTAPAAPDPAAPAGP
ncbi:hydantoinase B/oxoprolinase family protein [Parafrankia sp. EUN1f]|uniref:hydantoinase B/oxoprolinase family protein n=1 Tax=Parafrankia sp. EUN1f TaxID=102897 RepID=UPI0001C45A6F|nr:hydantoinase B/oxoprolinase family protein [Parafrankia sp. EUN1f]EFC82761.1 5-oxoprolinase (ATP-hydrolyzing) [Parafrankia sp. EUN1f]